MNKYIPISMIVVSLALIPVAYLVTPGMEKSDTLRGILIIVAAVISVTASVLVIRNERSN